jgi:DNA-binding MarR family transcriptional regulator
LIDLLHPPQGAPAATAGPPLHWAELTELLGRCERSLREELSSHAVPLGLTQAQFSLLWACRQAPPEGLSQNELAIGLALSPAHVSGQVEQLRAKGWLAGQRRAPDRRRQVWQLTAEGDARLESVLSALVQWAEHLDDQMSPQRRQELASLLGDLAQALALPEQQPS